MGATITPTGTPASLSVRIASNRLAGVDGARLHGAGEVAVERRDRERDCGEPAPCHAGQNVRIARHQRRLGHDADGMIATVPAPRAHPA